MTEFDMSQFASAFIEEATDLLEQANDAVLQIEVNPTDELLNSLFRAIHTIKGTAATVGFDHISEFTHHLETLLDKLRNKELEVSPEIIDVILEGLDAINEMITAIQENREHQVNTEELINKINAFFSSEMPEEKKKEEKKTDTLPISEQEKEWAQKHKKENSRAYKIILDIPDDYLENGYDPLAFLVNLKSNSSHMLVSSKIENIPCLDSFSPLKFYLHPEILVISDKSDEELRGLFFDKNLVKIMPITIDDKTANFIDYSQVAREDLEELSRSIEDYFDSIEPIIIEMEKGKIQMDDGVNSLFRVFHNIKGDAGYIGFKFLEDFCHKVETVLDKIRSGKFTFDEKTVDLILECITTIRNIMSSALKKEQIEVPYIYTVLEKLIPSLEKGETSLPSLEVSTFLSQAEQFLELIEMGLSKEKMDTNQILRGINGLSNAAKFLGLKDFIELINQFRQALQEDKDYQKYLENIKSYIEELESPPKKLGELLIEAGLVTKQDVEEAVKEQKKIGEILVEKGKVSKEELDLALIKQKVRQEASKVKSPDTTKSAMPTTIKTMRVNQEKIDKFTNTIGELVVAKNAYEYLVMRLIKEFNLSPSFVKEFKDNAYLISRITQDLQRDIMSLRMVPIRNIFQKFARIVRDISRRQNKKINLQIIGEETEIDKKVADVLNDPLVHLVRNACDHGIEPPKEREEKGKTPEGTVILKAYQEGSFVYIEVVDDGRGIDPEKVLKKAIEKGIITGDEKLSQNEILNLIFEPGFSTAEKVSDISGRGVGMDVVKNSITMLGGNVDIQSEINKGTRIVLKIPVTIGVSTALLIENQGEVYAIPIESVVKTVKISADEIKDLHYGKGIVYRGSILPVYSLTEILLGEEKPLKGEISIVILDVEGEKYGLIVDNLLNRTDIAIKSVPEYFEHLHYISGITILGDGRAILVLNPHKLL